jgi:deazaflavin-dependent oxidoreductase (nitroreductase family)
MDHLGTRVANWYRDYLRWLYRGGRPNRFARLQNRASALVFAAGIWPRRLAALEVRGRRSGRTVSFPVVITDHDGERYLVAMLGEGARWVRNVRADGGRAVLRHGRRENVRLEEVDAEDRPSILRRYLELAPGARPHIPIDRTAPLDDFARVAPTIPVFRITDGGRADVASAPQARQQVRIVPGEARARGVGAHVSLVSSSVVRVGCGSSPARPWGRRTAT